MLLHRDRRKIIKVVEPDLDEKHYAGFNTGLRPYRKGGIRLETTQFENKHVLHNYGHGGGGVSLFFGSCKQSLEQFDALIQKKNIKPKRITVIGSG